MKAVVMAGGEGTRLRPITSNLPKPMVSVVNKPIIEHILNLLKQHEITDIVVTLQFLPQVIKSYFGEGSDLGLSLSYAIEETPLGTAGSIRNAAEYLTSTFLVISGDALTDFDLTKIIKFHRRKKAMVTIALVRVKNPLEFGIVITDKEGRIEQFLEKPTWGEVFSDTINTGIYVLEPEILDYIPAGQPFDFSKDLFPYLLKEGKPLYGCLVDGYWCDVGSIEQYINVHHDILDRKVKVEPMGVKMLEDIWLDEGSDIHPSADLSGPIVIGSHVRIRAGAKIGPHTVVGNNVFISENAEVISTIVDDNTFIGAHAKLNSCVVGKNCDIRQGAHLEPEVVVGGNCAIGEGAVIGQKVKIFPFKTVDAAAVVNKSIILESRGIRTLFGKHGVSGLINIDITPDLAVRLGLAYGTSLHKDSHILISRDTSRASRMIKRALIAGLNATGIHCRDLRVCPQSVNRFNIATSRCVGGIHAQVMPGDPQSLEIKFFDEHGVDISESQQRTIERYYFREDCRRVFYNEVAEIIFPPRTVEFYIAGLLKHVDKNLIKERKFKVIVDYAYGSSTLTMPTLIGSLGCDVVALHAYTDETKSTLDVQELPSFLDQLSNTVKVFRADLGILLDSAGEKIFLIDDEGRVISHNNLLHLMVLLVSCCETKKGKIAVPLSVSNVVDEIAYQHGRRVLRTKVSARALMESALRKDVAFAGAQGGGFIFPQFLPAYDGIMTFCKIMEYLATLKQPLSKLVDSLPAYHLTQKNTYCSWESKGIVMRRLIERSRDKRRELIDGVKIYEDNRWVLVVPDSEEPLFRVFAEADSDERAKAELDNYINFINSIVSTM